MKKLLLAFILTLLIHILFIVDIGVRDKSSEEKVENIPKPNSTSEVKFVKLAPLEPVIKQKKDMSKPITKQEPTVNKQKKDIRKEFDDAKTFQENILEETTKFQNKTLENFLSQKDTIYNSEVFNELKELYGKEYDDFTTVQKAYLEKNINNFQIITQRVLNRLGYPHEAVRLKITGINIVEFIFHPNGDISDLRIIQSSGYSILDNRTLELIQIAYKEYPKPQTPTLLRFKVFYRLY
ncbi:energy transducer TonB [Aliarcobacter skirrowii]|uniref:energy transducer TonB n=1 Tax=Aliarcobacter skirrowii TaxID=28200 RepID=UPI000826593D|nr:energy transducer TonB [Aliarcobacter skirrowii]